MDKKTVEVIETRVAELRENLSRQIAAHNAAIAELVQLLPDDHELKQNGRVSDDPPDRE